MHYKDAHANKHNSPNVSISSTKYAQPKHDVNNIRLTLISVHNKFTIFTIIILGQNNSNQETFLTIMCQPFFFAKLKMELNLCKHFVNWTKFELDPYLMMLRTTKIVFFWKYLLQIWSYYVKLQWSEPVFDLYLYSMMFKLRTNINSIHWLF